MKIELKNIKIAAFMSQETTSFVADIYVNGKKVGYAHNEGTGGSTNCQPYGVENFDVFKQAENFCKSMPAKVLKYEGEKDITIPMDLESFIEDLLYEEINRREEAKIAKKYETKIIMGVKGSGTYGEVKFGKGKGVPLAQIPREKLQACVDKYKKELKEGETFWNTNFEQLGIKV